MKALCSALATLLLLTTGCVKRQAQPEDPRAINSTYSGTKRIDVFESLVFESFAYDNRAYFQSMIYPREPQNLADGQTKPILITPNGKMTKFESISLTEMNPKYSFPHLPPKAKLLGTIKAKDSCWTVGWPIASIDGSIFIVRPLYTE